MLRYKTETRPSLVVLYNIRPGNGAGLFLQPRSPHGANMHNHTSKQYAQLALCPCTQQDSHTFVKTKLLKLFPKKDIPFAYIAMTQLGDRKGIRPV